jgi:hypothetical protein
MKDQPFPVARRWWTSTILLLTALGPVAVAHGQSQAVPAISAFPTVDAQVKPIPTIPTEDGITTVGCSSCGGILGGGGCMGCGSGSGQCSPGRHTCDCCCSTDTCVGRFINGVYQCVCCPDPCWDPQWLAVADAAFFVNAARPVTQMRLRFDQMWRMNSPDRAEYFWAKASGTRADGSAGGKGPHPVSSIDVSDVRLYTEAAAGRAGISIDIPYRRIEGDFNSSGFADMIIGTKAMLLDCELLQITFAMDTTVPSGAAPKGLGTAHVSLEPSLIWGVKLAANTYLQAQTGLWIPIGGDPAYQGNIFDYRFSLNQILYKPCNDLQVIGTLELNGWSILNGGRTDFDLNLPVGAKGNLIAGGPGIRCVICDKIDFGIGSMFSFTNQRWAEEMIRIDFRWRF